MTQRILLFLTHSLLLTAIFLPPSVLAADTFPGNGLDFDGSDDYVSMPAAISNGIESVTVEAWVRSNALSQSSVYRGIVTEVYVYAGDGNVEFELFLEGSNHNLSAGFYDGSWHQVSDATPFPVGAWVHVAATYDGHYIRVYRDGREVAASSDLNRSLPNGTNGWRIGGGHAVGDAARLWNGMIDEVRVWNVARTTAQLREDMHLTLSGSESGLVSYYQFNESSGTTAADAAGTNDGTLYNMTDADWVASTVPIGGGASTTQVVSGTGTVDFTGTGLSMSFTAKAGTDIFVVARIDAAPNVNPTGLREVFDDQYWVVDQFGSGTFTADLTFTVSEDLTAGDESNPSDIRLSQRESNADGVWTPAGGAASVNAAANAATFDDIAAFSQLILGSEALVAMSFSPADDATGVARDANLIVTFDRSVEAGSGDITIKRTADDGVFKTIAASATSISGAEVTIDPTADFDFATGYYVQIDGDAFHNGSGHYYAGISDKQTWNFETAWFNDLSAGLTGVAASSVAWGDYDNDGDLDILLMGYYNISRVYRNNEGAFADIGAGLPGGDEYIMSSVAWGDYDNDGDLDILLTGYYISRVYRNDGGNTFTDIVAGLPEVPSGSVAWGDYDNDGDLDILLTGYYWNGSPISHVYRNDGGDVFTYAAGLPGVYAGSVAWGDYDNDGDLDILLTGIVDYPNSISRVYRNDGGAFTDIGAGLPGVYRSSVAWGDTDNDGDLDILLTGITDSGRISRVYRNDGGNTFTDIGAGLPGVDCSSVAWGDYDNDGDLDILLTGDTGSGTISRVYRNNTGSANTPPLAPTGLSATASGDSIVFHWNAATDSETPAAGLTYNLWMGTSSEGVEVCSPMADLSGGTRRVAQLGNANQNLTWTIRPPTYPLYWSVQAVDHAFAGSAFAPTQSLTLATSFSPADDAVGVALNANLILTFNRSVTAGSGDITIRRAADDVVFETIAASATSISGAEVTIDPTGHFGSLTGYYVLIDGEAFHDGLGHYYAGISDTQTWNFEGSEEPLVTSFSPADDAVGVGPNANLILTFDRSVTAGIGSITIKRTSDDGVFETFAASATSISGAEVTIDPAVDFDFSTGYYVLIDEDAFQDGSGHYYAGISDTQTWNFEEIEEFLVASFSPADDAVGVAPNANLIITFNRSVTAGSGDITIRRTADDAVFETVAASATSFSGAEVTIDPTGHFGSLTGYYVQIDGNAFHDRLGHYYAGISDTQTWNFEEGEEPLVTSFSPADDAVGVAPNANLILTFDRSVTASIGNITIKRTADDAVFETLAAGATSISGAEVTMDPTGDLDFLTGYYVLIDGDAFHDGSGHYYAGISDKQTWNFETTVTGLFTDLAAGLTGVRLGSVAWGDYDNDGDLDILLTGEDSGEISRVYRNNGDDTFTDVAAGLAGVSNGSVAWGDYDNDGDLDILLTGYTAGSVRISRVYRNDGDDTFTDVAAGLTGVYGSSVAWGDYDNDGDLDILLTGSSSGGRISRVYRNNGDDTFSYIAGLPGVSNGSVAWGDYDNDGDLDILLTGDYWDGSLHYISRVYRNNGGAFTDVSAGLPGVAWWSSVAWGDYDNDGDLDILLTGFTGSGWISRVYRNTGGAFTYIAGLTGVYMSSAAWGDYDNDGDLDILLTGRDSGDNAISRVYRNNGGAFTDVSAGLTGVYESSAAWGDYDNDGDLDILLTGRDSGDNVISRVYRNNASTANTAPSAPTGLSATPVADAIAFGWNAAADNETPSEGLTYNLRVGTSAGGVEVCSPMADLSDGTRRVAQLGNANHNLTWTIGAPTYPTRPQQIHYYWSVQAVDHTFAGSAFAPTEGAPVEYLAVYNNDEMAPDDVLTWEVQYLDDVEDYQVQIDDDADFGSPAVDDTLSIPTGQPKVAGSVSVFGIPLNELTGYGNLSDDTVYHWRMRPNYEGGLTTVFPDSGPSFFFNKANSAPDAPTSGFTPAGDVAIGTLAPVIAWNNAADPDLSDHSDSLRSTIQVDTLSDFSTVVFSTTTDYGVTSVEITPDLLDAHRYYYRIKTTDDEGLESGWSSTQQFRTNTATTVFAQPSGSPKVASMQTFACYGEDAACVHWDAGGTVPDSLGLTLTPGTSYFNLPSGANAVSRYWTFDPLGGAGWTATVRLYYDDSEFTDPPIQEALLRMWRTQDSGHTWDEVPVTARDVAENWVEGTVTSFSDFVLSGYDTALPVTFSSFAARAGDGQVTLHWVTESEVDNLGFYVYRALDPEGVYERLTAELIEGAGTSTSRRAYTFSDVRLTNGVTYWYKIEAVASDGATTLYGPIPVTPRVAEPVQVEALPTEFGLSQNFPNPFNPVTEIRYRLPEDSHVALVIYDLLGRKVQVLVDGFVDAGYRTTVWDAKEVASGVYFVRMEAGEFVAVRKMVLMR